MTDKNGNFYVLRTVYPYNPGLTNTREDNAYKGKGVKKIVKYSPSGDEIWAGDITDKDASSYIKDMAYVKGSGILTYSAEGFSIYDEMTGEGHPIEMEKKGDIHKDRKLITSEEGKVYVLETDSKWRYVLYEYDSKKKTLTKKTLIPEDAAVGAEFFTGLSYKFYYLKDNCLYGFNPGDKKSDKICDFPDSGFYADDILHLLETKEGEFQIIARFSSGSGGAFSMEKAENGNYGKKVITIGIFRDDNDIKEQVIKFNQENSEYNVRLFDYSNTSVSGYHSVYDRIVADLENGEAPDILILDSFAKLSRLSEKGYLEPLDEYIKNDDEISQINYLSNINKTLSENGAQYAVMPYFTINTCAASKDVFGGEAISLSNYRNLCNRHNIRAHNMMRNVYFEGVDTLYETSGFNFIDFDSGTCDFQNYNFINLITLIREIKRAEESNTKVLDENCYREKKAMLLPYNITCFQDYRIIRNGYFDSDIFFNGYPSAEGGISYIDPGILLTINSKCENKKEAFNFIKYFLMDEYQYSIDWGFPVNEGALMTLMEQSTTAKYYIDDSGKRVNTNSQITIGSKSIIISPLSYKEAEEMRAFIASLERLQYRDPEIIKMMAQSLSLYYGGEIAAEKAALIVQDKIEKYFEEK